MLQLPTGGAARAQPPARASKRNTSKPPTEPNQKGRETGDGQINGENGLLPQDELDNMTDVVTRDMKLEFVNKIKKLSN